MRYKPEHKERTRRRIVTVAARLFRERGYDGVGIDDIMAAAGLTRGGFYGHFRSKQALLAAVMGGPHDFTRRMAARRGRDRDTLRREALEIVGGYLDPTNRERIGRGCSLASLSVDVARGGRAARSAYTETVDELAGEFARSVAGARPRDPRALASIALCVGGLILSRAVADEELARALAAACRSGVNGELMRREDSVD